MFDFELKLYLLLEHKFVIEKVLIVIKSNGLSNEGRFLLYKSSII